MKHCPHCNIYIRNPREYCPLCQSRLTDGETGEILTDDFPELPSPYTKYRFLFQLLLFFSVIAAVSSLIVNYYHQESGWWSLIVTAAVGYFWIAVIYLLRTRSSLGGIARATILLSLLLLLIDCLYGFSKWSTNYAIPALFLASIVAVVVLSVIRGQGFADFALYILITGGFALLPILFLLTDLATISWPSLVCTLCGLFSLVGIFIFADKGTLDELNRRFHL